MNRCCASTTLIQLHPRGHGRDVFQVFLVVIEIGCLVQHQVQSILFDRAGQERAAGSVAGDEFKAGLETRMIIYRIFQG